MNTFHILSGECSNNCTDGISSFEIESDFNYHDESFSRLSPVPSVNCDRNLSQSPTMLPHSADSTSLNSTHRSGSSMSVSSFNLSSPSMDTDGGDSFDFSSPDKTAQFDNDSIFSPFYSGSSVTLCGAVSAIMNFCTSAKLSYVAIEKLLKLLDLLCPSPNSLPKSVHFLKKFFKRFKFEYSQNEYCSECFQLTDDCSCTA